MNCDVVIASCVTIIALMLTKPSVGIANNHASFDDFTASDLMFLTCNLMSDVFKGNLMYCNLLSEANLMFWIKIR